MHFTLAHLKEKKNIKERRLHRVRVAVATATGRALDKREWTQRSLFARTGKVSRDVSIFRLVHLLKALTSLYVTHNSPKYLE